jgi:hypothetical protein
MMVLSVTGRSRECRTKDGWLNARVTSPTGRPARSETRRRGTPTTKRIRQTREAMLPANKETSEFELAARDREAPGRRAGRRESISQSGLVTPRTSDALAVADTMILGTPTMSRMVVGTTATTRTVTIPLETVAVPG